MFENLMINVKFKHLFSSRLQETLSNRNLDVFLPPTEPHTTHHAVLDLKLSSNLSQRARRVLVQINGAALLGSGRVARWMNPNMQPKS